MGNFVFTSFLVLSKQKSQKNLLLDFTGDACIILFKKSLEASTFLRFGRLLCYELECYHVLIIFLLGALKFNLLA